MSNARLHTGNSLSSILEQWEADNVVLTERGKDKNGIQKILMKILGSQPPCFIASIRRALEKNYESTSSKQS